MASTRGRCAAAFASESMMPSMWYCGSGWWYGSHTVSSLKTTRPSIAAAQVEADPAALEMASERSRLGALLRQVARVHDCERMIEHLLAHEGRVEASGGGVAVVRGELGDEGRRSIDEQAPAAARPQQ